MATERGIRWQLTAPAVALWRSPGVLQVGMDAPALVLERVPPGLADAIPLLARPHSHDELHSLLPSLESHWLRWLVERLHGAGMLAPVTAATQARVCVVGGGPLGTAVAGALEGCAASISHLDPVSFAMQYHGHDGPDLVVLAGTTAEPDRATTDALFRDGRSHLVVRVEPGRAVLGPFVQPGRTPCVRCLDLTRVRLDAGWPGMLAQLCREPVAPEPVLLGWLAATAAVQVRAWLAGGTPETAGSSLELGLGDFRLHSRSWPAHPACGCLLPPG